MEIFRICIFDAVVGYSESIGLVVSSGYWSLPRLDGSLVSSTFSMPCCSVLSAVAICIWTVTMA